MDADRLEQTNVDLRAHDEHYVVPTPDGTYLLTSSGSEGRVLELEAGEPRATFPVGDHVGPTPATDGSCFACNDEESVQIRSLPEADLMHAFPVPGNMRLLGRNLLGPRGEYIYLPGPPWPPGDWTRFRTATGEAGPSYPGVNVGHPWGADVRAFALSADGTHTAVTGATGPVGGGFVGVYDAASGELVDDWQLAGEGSHVALSPDGTSIVSVTEGGTIVGDSWHASVGDGRVVDVEFVRDGERVFVAINEGALTLLDAETGAIEATDRTSMDLRWARTTADASHVTVGGDRARAIAPGW